MFNSVHTGTFIKTFKNSPFSTLLDKRAFKVDHCLYFDYWAPHGGHVAAGPLFPYNHNVFTKNTHILQHDAATAVSGWNRGKKYCVDFVLIFVLHLVKSVNSRYNV